MGNTPGLLLAAFLLLLPACRDDSPSGAEVGELREQMSQLQRELRKGELSAKLTEESRMDSSAYDDLKLQIAELKEENEELREAAGSRLLEQGGDAQLAAIAETYKEDNAHLREALVTLGKDREALAAQLKGARQEVAALQARPPPTPAVAAVRPTSTPSLGYTPSSGRSGSAVKPVSGAATGFWISKNSRKRHNSGCRWYGNSIGRYCGANDGIACKICGG